MNGGARQASRFQRRRGWPCVDALRFPARACGRRVWTHFVFRRGRVIGRVCVWSVCVCVGVVVWLGGLAGRNIPTGCPNPTATPHAYALVESNDTKGIRTLASLTPPRVEHHPTQG